MKMRVLQKCCTHQAIRIAGAAGSKFVSANELSRLVFGGL
jgi:hypothetical protein